MINRLCIIGVGLIGGSVARSARARHQVKTIQGFDSNPENLRKSQELGVIDEACRSPEEAVKGADLVVIATPVGAAEALLTRLKPCWSEHTVYTDVGSTKVGFRKAAERVFEKIPANLVPGHPIAGAEMSGVEAARADLFAGKRVILTPLPETSETATETVRQFWLGLDAIVSIMKPDHHDAVFAATSHLPHVLAFVLTEMLGRKDEQDEIFQYAAGGFRDFTRIASSDPRMWVDICMANQAEITQLIKQYCKALEQATAMLAGQDEQQLFTLFERAQGARQRFLDQPHNKTT